jgi:GntR family transcriptional regulator
LFFTYGLFVATPRQRLSDDERSRRLDEAVQRFAGDVIGLDYPAAALLDRVAAELQLCLPKKSA